MASHPTFGVEEEFLLADPTTGEPVAENKAVAAHAAEHGVKLQLELSSCQVETTSEVVGGSDALRKRVDPAAHASPPKPPRPTARNCSRPRCRPRGSTTSPSPTPLATARSPTSSGWSQRRACAEPTCTSRYPAARPRIRVSNRLRPWLPLFLALSANSAVYRNADTGYASWRSIVWARWPSAGPPPHFDSVDEYDGMVRMLQRAGARARRRHGLLGRPPVGQVPDDRGACRRRAGDGRRDRAAGHADPRQRDDGARR